MKAQSKGTGKISLARPKGELVEFILITKENLKEVAEWCNGWVSGLTQVEFYSQLRGHYGKASIGHYLVKESDNPRHFREYSSTEFNTHFEEVTDGSSGT